MTESGWPRSSQARQATSVRRCAQVLTHGAAEFAAADASQMHRMNANTAGDGGHGYRVRRLGVEQVERIAPPVAAGIADICERRMQVRDRFPEGKFRGFQSSGGADPKLQHGSGQSRRIEPAIVQLAERGEVARALGQDLQKLCPARTEEVGMPALGRLDDQRAGLRRDVWWWRPFPPRCRRRPATARRQRGNGEAARFPAGSGSCECADRQRSARVRQSHVGGARWAWKPFPASHGCEEISRRGCVSTGNLFARRWVILVIVTRRRNSASYHSGRNLHASLNRGIKGPAQNSRRSEKSPLRKAVVGRWQVAAA